jgi:hypothetical protein
MRGLINIAQTGIPDLGKDGENWDVSQKTTVPQGLAAPD